MNDEVKYLRYSQVVCNLSTSKLEDFERFNEWLDGRWERSHLPSKYNINAVKTWLQIRDKLKQVDSEYSTTKKYHNWTTLQLVESPNGLDGRVFVDVKGKVWRDSVNIDEYYSKQLPRPFDATKDVSLLNKIIEREENNKLFASMISMIGFDVIKCSKSTQKCKGRYGTQVGKYRVKDRQGGNLGDIESDRYDDVNDLIDRFDVYWNDYIYEDLNEEFGHYGLGDVNKEVYKDDLNDTESWCKWFDEHKNDEKCKEFIKNHDIDFKALKFFNEGTKIDSEAVWKILGAKKDKEIKHQKEIVR